MLLSVCMIVKDEEDVLARCLESVKGLADEIIIVDTGSSKTIFLVQSGTGSKATYATYTGYANVPSMSKASRRHIALFVLFISDSPFSSPIMFIR